MSALLIFIPMVLFFVFSAAIIAYTTFGVEKAPAFLRPLLRHVGKAIDALDELMEEERKAQLMMQQQQYPLPSPSKPVDSDSDIFRQPAAPVQTRLSESESRFFQLQEMAIACKFEPRVADGELQLTSKELSRLKDYCALAFDKPLSVPEFLAPLGLKATKKARPRR